jgi:hypothetical protein
MAIQIFVEIRKINIKDTMMMRRLRKVMFRVSSQRSMYIITSTGRNTKNADRRKW